MKFIHKRAGSPPIGLLTVAAMLPTDWSVRLVDLNVERLRAKDLAWADLAMVSGMVVQRESARRLIGRCKAAGLKVVAGGPLFTIEHEQFDDVDHFVLNEAEVTLPPFLEDLKHGRAKRLYTSTEFADLRQTPVPRWDLANLKRYGWTGVQFSRGCPFNCDFCNVTTLFGHKFRTKTSAQILAELDSLYDRGWRGGVFFVDDNLVGKKEVLRTDLLPALIAWQKSHHVLPFQTQVSMDLADDVELMEMMVEAGFHMVFIGVETPDEASLVECNKKQNQGRDLVADVKRMQRTGLQVQGGFIVGFDSDGPSIFQRQIDFIQKSGIVTAMVNLLQAFPGTKLYERLNREGRLLGRTSGDGVDGTTNLVPRMNLERLREGYRNVLERIYSPKRYYERVRIFLREYRAPKVQVRMQLQYVLAFLRSILRLGILDKGRLGYWRLLIWTHFRRPELFALAVTLAISGYHCRKVCRSLDLK
ncbi:MAG TPA: B12-binding domain-containing radical SAM protein [Phycisphaerae bacterium]|nr:B12-binding domain-containing radical SAM protein [Phycisphaerae bacterium]